MIRVMVSFSGRTVGSKTWDVLEFEDDTTQTEIDQVCEEWVWENSNANWYRIDEAGEPIEEIE